MNELKSRVVGLVLAGGLARRMGGGDKARLRVGGQTILERVLERLAAQCATIVINANGNPARFADTELPVIPDTVSGFVGPLAGILAGLEWAAKHAPGVSDVVSVPGDCPFLPSDLVTRLATARRAAGVPLACAQSGEWRHPVIGLWPVTLQPDLRKALVERGLRKVEMFTQPYGIALASWPTTPVDPFFNVNTPEDASEANRMAAASETATA
jgi:molybdopterin-guanine dinucleotide biosynthesis protein A